MEATIVKARIEYHIAHMSEKAGLTQASNGKAVGR